VHSFGDYLLLFFLEYIKMAQIAMVQVLSNMKDERCFNSLALCKSKLHNWLTTNLGFMVRIFSQKFYSLQNFPYAKIIWALVVGRTPLIWCGSLGFQSSSSLIQKLEVGTIPWFWLISCNLQRFVRFFCIGVGASIMHTSDRGLLIYTIPFVFICLWTLDNLWVFV